MSWKTINLKIKECRSLPVASQRIDCLKKLFMSVRDGMVAFALGEELEACEKLMEALQYFEKAEVLFPMTEYKNKARQAALRVRNKLLQEQKGMETASISTVIDLEKYDPQTTLIVVACTKTKIWEIDKNAPDFVPAKLAYRGESFRKFLKWAEESGLEQKGFKWIILSAKYGYIEPWHPICNYDVTFSDETTGPISDETLYRQVMYQSRWSGIPLRNFKTVILYGNEVYFDKVRVSFRETNSNVIHARL